MKIPRFQCSKCRRLFDVKETIEDSQNKIACPFCNEVEIEDLHRALELKTQQKMEVVCTAST